MQKSDADNVNNSLDDYYASHRAPAIINGKLKIGRVFAEYKDKLFIIDGEDKKEHEYLIPAMGIKKYISIFQKML